MENVMFSNKLYFDGTEFCINFSYLYSDDEVVFTMKPNLKLGIIDEEWIQSNSSLVTLEKGEEILKIIPKDANLFRGDWYFWWNANSMEFAISTDGDEKYGDKSGSIVPFYVTRKDIAILLAKYLIQHKKSWNFYVH